MSRGGYRPGAGRPKSAPAPAAKPAAIMAAPAADVPMAPGQVTPLAYMLDVINDPSADETRRDRMAIAAAPFVHPKAGDATPGKKAQAKAKAADAGKGTGWGDDLTFNEVRAN